MTNEPIKELPEGIESWKAYRRILDIMVDSVSDEIMNLVEYLNSQKGIIDPGDEDQVKSDEFYERYEEPVEELIWQKISESFSQNPRYPE